MSENEIVMDISPSEVLSGTTCTGSVMQQANNVNTQAAHDYSMNYTEYGGAKAKIYTSTPVKFTPEDSVFSKTEVEENLSKSDVDSIIQKQLHRIQEINKKYEELAKSKLERIKTEHSLDLNLPFSSEIYDKVTYQDIYSKSLENPITGSKIVTVTCPSIIAKSQIGRYSPTETKFNTNTSRLPPYKDHLRVTFSLPSAICSVNDTNQNTPLVHTCTHNSPILANSAGTGLQPSQINTTNENTYIHIPPANNILQFTSTANEPLSVHAPITAHEHQLKSVKRKEKEPDKFDGRNVEWRDYIVHFEQVSAWNTWSDIEKAQQLAMSLRGQAQKLLGELKQGEIHKYEDLKKILSQRYDPQERSVAYRCEFRTRKRKKNESPADFAFALRRLAALAYPDMPYDYREINVLEQYLTSVGSTELKNHVIFQHPKSLDEAISHTVEYEAVKGNQTVPSKPNTQSDEGYIQAVKQTKNENLSPTSTTSTELNKLIQTLNTCMDKWNKTLEQLQQLNQNKPVKKDYSNYTCFGCKLKGHIARNCPNKIKFQEQTPFKKSEN